MNVLELFAGSRSFSKVAKSEGMNVFTTDIEPFENIDYTVDILDIDLDKIPFKPDIIWASPPCTSFSVASIGKHWNKDKTPKTENALLGMRLVEKALQIIDYYKPKYWFIENPRGMLRTLPIMQTLPRRVTVTYCQYGDTRMKPTDIWTNCLEWEPKPACKNGDPCHERAPIGSRTGTQGLKDSYLRSAVPEELCREIIKWIKMN